MRDQSPGLHFVCFLRFGGCCIFNSQNYVQHVTWINFFVFIHLFIHSFSNYLLSNGSLPSTMLGSGLLHKQDKVPSSNQCRFVGEAMQGDRE